jgi:hypothetical protein
MSGVPFAIAVGKACRAKASVAETTDLRAAQFSHPSLIRLSCPKHPILVDALFCQRTVKKRIENDTIRDWQQY